MAETSTGTAVVTLPADDEILITREFNAARHLVYRAWTTPELVKRWWSGGMGKVTVAEIDLRVGGRWRYVITGDDGSEVAFHGEFREIVPNERLVHTEVFEMAPDNADGGADNDDDVIDIVTFTETDGRTRLELLVQTPNQQVRDAIIDSGMETGMQRSYDLLEQVAVSLA